MTTDLAQQTVKVNVVVNILVSTVSVAISGMLIYNAISVKIAVNNDKLDTLIAQNEKILNKVEALNSSWETRFGNLALKIGHLETLEGIRER